MINTTLSAADLKAVQQGLYALNVADQEAENLTACGLECGEEIARCQYLKGFLEAVLTRYSPEQKPRASRKS